MAPAAAAQESHFVDTAGSVHEPAIETIAALGITLGCNPPINDRFCPEDPVTRGQMAAFLVRAFVLPDAGSSGFTDTLGSISVSYTHLRAHETVLDLVCRLLLEKK